MMSNQSNFDGIHVVAKFFLSKSPDGNMHLISRTLGKFSVLDTTSTAHVVNGDIWLCRITKEIRPGQNAGAFVLFPVKKVEPLEVRKLIPGFYEVNECEGTVILKPTESPSDYWMTASTTRQVFSRKYRAIIVPVLQM